MVILLETWLNAEVRSVVRFGQVGGNHLQSEMYETRAVSRK